MPAIPTCPVHKTYQGKRKPVNGCPQCQEVYDYRHGTLHPAKMKEINQQNEPKPLVPCSKHPGYKGIKKPKDCPECQAFYNAKHGISENVQQESAEEPLNPEKEIKAKVEVIQDDGKTSVIKLWEKLEGKYLNASGDLVSPITGDSFHLINYDPENKIATVIVTSTRGIHISELQKLKVASANYTNASSSTLQALDRSLLRQQLLKDIQNVS